MELRHLRYFIAVAEEENVTRAAARLHVSQPPLTRQIRDLEDELGFSLFVRSGKALRLTDAGRAFAAEAKAVLARLDAGIAAARSVATGRAGQLQVGYAPSPSAAFLPVALRRFQAEHPDVRVVLHDQSTPQMLEGLRERKLQLGLMMEPLNAARTGLVFEPLRSFAITVAASRDHPFARRRQVALEDVLAEPVVVFARSEFPDYHDLLTRLLGPKVQRLRIVEECDSGMSLIAAVEAGRGVAITIPAIAASAGQRLRFIPITPALPFAVMGVAYRNEPASTLAAAFVQELKVAARHADRGRSRGGKA